MLTTAGVTSFSRGARVGTWPSGPTIGVPANDAHDNVEARAATAKTATGRRLCIMLANPSVCRRRLSGGWPAGHKHPFSLEQPYRGPDLGPRGLRVLRPASRL